MTPPPSSPTDWRSGLLLAIGLVAVIAERVLS